MVCARPGRRPAGGGRGATFDAGDTSKTFDFAATQDAEDDDGESVKLAFGALPTGVSEGSANQATGCHRAW